VAGIILLNKPFNCLSQFTGDTSQTTLSDIFAKKHIGSNYYAAGRLDYDSEGLLLLTDSGQLQHRITSPKAKMEKTYWVQVEGVPSNEALNKLRQGVYLKDGLTDTATVTTIDTPDIWQRHPPVRQRAHISTQWLSVTITEGKNRQVRRMTAAVGFPTLRLIRVAIGPWQLGHLQPGEFRKETVNLPQQTQQRKKRR